MVPVTELLQGLPVVVIVIVIYCLGSNTSDGVPDMVAIPEATFKLTPAGNPVTVAPVAPSTRS